MAEPQGFMTFQGLGRQQDSKGADSDDLYAGFQPNPGFGGANPLNPNPLQPPASQAGMGWGGGQPGTQWGAPPPGSSAGGFAMGTMGAGTMRPMTSNQPTNYTSQFDPLKGGNKHGPAPPLAKKSENSPEEECLDVERKVNALIEESAELSRQKDFSIALEKAKEASKKERMLCKMRENYNLSDQNNIDLTYSVHFNLAVQYQHNQLYTEALNTYSLIVRNKQYAMSGRLRVNMGNIYMEQGKFPLAIKMYRMALDQIPNTAKDLRFKIMRNIGNCFVKIGQYQDAISSYEAIMEGCPDIVTGFNLLLCYYALGDRDKLKRHYVKVLSIRKYGATDEDDDITLDDIDEENKEVLLDDGLKQDIRDKRKQHMDYLLTGARLIAPMIDKDWQTGFDYIIEQLRHYELKDTNSRLATEMEMCKALMFMSNKEYSKAIDALRAFEKKDRHLRAKAATNLAYLFFLEGDMENGDKYSTLAIDSDKYNAKAHVNKANFIFTSGDYDAAKEKYLEALKIEADNIEALYNLGLAMTKLKQHEDALRVFKKLQAMIPDSVEVIYQIGHLYDLLCDNHNACEWFHRLISRVPTDPGILARLGTIYAKEEDESQAFHYHLEAYRYFPVNMDVISWLGAYFVRNEVYEKAMQFFERASQIQPNEVKWQLMVASCHRRIAQYPQARRMYEEIHKKYPDNVECLTYLIHLYNDTNLKDEAEEAYKKLQKLRARRQEQGDFAASTRNVDMMNDDVVGDGDGDGDYGGNLDMGDEDGGVWNLMMDGDDAGGFGGGEDEAPKPKPQGKGRSAAAQKKALEQAKKEEEEDFDLDDVLPDS